jgi:hypothetical protein
MNASLRSVFLPQIAQMNTDIMSLNIENHLCNLCNLWQQNRRAAGATN